MIKEETGILLLALGHPYYGRMAYNLAMSIKAIDKNASITLVYTESAITHINQRYMYIFDNKFAIDNTSEPFGAKLLLDKLTPYERTLYMDVDTLWTNKQGPAKLFEKLKGTPFTGITEGFHDYDKPIDGTMNKLYPTWADLDEIKEEFDLTGKLFQWRGEFIYFEKCDRTEDFFMRAREVYGRAHDLKTVKKFAEHIPDELAINIAANLSGIEPHIFKWKPTFWDRLNGGNMADIADLQYNYYAISCGSNYNSGPLKRTYDRICAASASRLGLQHVFPLVNKKEMMINRQLM
jgi:hypothetical protein